MRIELANFNRFRSLGVVISRLLLLTRARERSYEC
jgi:hypothetical protein